MSNLTLAELTSRIRCFGKDNLSYWGCALAGEVGELCNMIKKYERDGQLFSKEQYGHELADIFIYTVLTARQLDINLEQAIIEKLAIVEKRRREEGKPTPPTDENCPFMYQADSDEFGCSLRADRSECHRECPSLQAVMDYVEELKEKEPAPNAPNLQLTTHSPKRTGGVREHGDDGVLGMVVQGDGKAGSPLIELPEWTHLFPDLWEWVDLLEAYHETCPHDEWDAFVKEYKANLRDNHNHMDDGWIATYFKDGKKLYNKIARDKLKGTGFVITCDEGVIWPAFSMDYREPREPANKEEEREKPPSGSNPDRWEYTCQECAFACMTAEVMREHVYRLHGDLDGVFITMMKEGSPMEKSRCVWCKHLISTSEGNYYCDAPGMEGIQVRNIHELAICGLFDEDKEDES